MIKIHKKLWVIKGCDRVVEDSEHLLAYMTHREYTKTGEESQPFIKRKSTGTNWAIPTHRWNRAKEAYEIPKYSAEENILEFDNTPVSGFRIVGSVCRWSTDNKLIRVEDPRGFVVEIPTGNLTTLLKHTIIDYAEVKEDCVWGREGNNHILLPVNSAVYKDAVTQIKQFNDMTNFTKLEKGDVIKFSVDCDYEYIFCGRGKAVWEIKYKQASKKANHNYGLWYGNKYRWSISEDDAVIETKTIRDSKLCFIFKNIKENKFEYKASGKCIPISKGFFPDVKPFSIWIPNRLKEEIGDVTVWSPNDNGVYYRAEVVDIEMK